jgi:hypothetical protein
MVSMAAFPLASRALAFTLPALSFGPDSLQANALQSRSLPAFPLQPFVTLAISPVPSAIMASVVVSVSHNDPVREDIFQSGRIAVSRLSGPDCAEARQRAQGGHFYHGIHLILP